MTSVRVDFPFLMEDRDRHGNVRVYVRRGGIKIRIREPKGSPGFAKAYAEAVYTLNHPGAKSRPAVEHTSAGTLGWLAAKCAGLQVPHVRLPARIRECRRRANVHGAQGR
jgi:hypothetical protein